MGHQISFMLQFKLRGTIQVSSAEFGSTFSKLCVCFENLESVGGHVITLSLTEVMFKS